MNLSNLARQILSEDSWGNNPSSGGGAAPGRSPTTTPPPATANVKFYDMKKDYGVFINTIEKQEEIAKKKLDADLSTQFGNKKVTVRASKGSVGQVEKDYDITVASVDIVYLKDKFYIVLTGTDKAEYFANPEFKVKIDANPKEAPTMDSKQGGNIIHQPVIGMASKANVKGA